MENASKALLIAGAVLICILLIGIGVAIYNASKAPSEHAKVTSEAMGDESERGAIEIALNLKFEIGKEYLASELQELIDDWNNTHEVRWWIGDGNVIVLGNPRPTILLPPNPEIIYDPNPIHINPITDRHVRLLKIIVCERGICLYVKFLD